MSELKGYINDLARYFRSFSKFKLLRAVVLKLETKILLVVSITSCYIFKPFSVYILV
jgi:hypothetical protein